MYKYDSETSGFYILFLVLAAGFAVSVAAGTIAAQFSDFSAFSYDTFYFDMSFPLKSIALSSLYAARNFILIFILSFFPFGYFFVITYFLIYGFSFSYTFVFFLSPVCVNSSALFYDFLISFIVFFPFLIYFTSSSVIFSRHQRGVDSVSVKSYLLSSCFFILVSYIISFIIKSFIYVICLFLV